MDKQEPIIEEWTIDGVLQSRVEVYLGDGPTTRERKGNRKKLVNSLLPRAPPRKFARSAWSDGLFLWRPGSGFLSANWQSYDYYQFHQLVYSPFEPFSARKR